MAAANLEIETDKQKKRLGKLCSEKSAEIVFIFYLPVHFLMAPQTSFILWPSNKVPLALLSIYSLKMVCVGRTRYVFLIVLQS